MNDQKSTVLESATARLRRHDFNKKPMSMQQAEKRICEMTKISQFSDSGKFFVTLLDKLQNNSHNPNALNVSSMTVTRLPWLDRCDEQMFLPTSLWVNNIFHC